LGASISLDPDIGLLEAYWIIFLHPIAQKLKKTNPLRCPYIGLLPFLRALVMRAARAIIVKSNNPIQHTRKTLVSKENCAIVWTQKS
jgi:hypothetical protein